MITHDDMKRVRTLFKVLTKKKIGFRSIKNSDEWTIREIEK